MAAGYIQPKLISDGKRNVVVRVTGALERDIVEPWKIFDTLLLQQKEPQLPKPKILKLQSIWWMIQEKMCLTLWWDQGHEMVFPMESRNAISFARWVEPPDSWGGMLYLTSEKFETCATPTAKFTLCLDFDR